MSTSAHERICSDCLIFALLFALSMASLGSTAHADETALVDAQITKLEWEIRKLAQDTEIAGSWWSRVVQIGPSATALVALIGVFITLRKQMNDSDARRREELRQLDAERVRRFDARFSDIVAGLGSGSTPVRVGAIVSIRSFLRAEYALFHEQVFLVLSANLRLAQDEDSHRLMIGAFEQALRTRVSEVSGARSEVGARDDERTLDLVRCHLDGARLPGLDNTELTGARFRASDLRWVHFDDANLQGARFERALLQSALFRNATLHGARFEQADLNNASFVGAKLDRQAKTSIVKAFHWREAHFDSNVHQELLDIERAMHPR